MPAPHNSFQQTAFCGFEWQARPIARTIFLPNTRNSSLKRQLNNTAEYNRFAAEKKN